MEDVLVGSPGSWSWTCSLWIQLGIDIIDARLRRLEMVVSPAPALRLVLDMLAHEGHYQLIVEQFDLRIDNDVPPRVRRPT